MTDIWRGLIALRCLIADGRFLCFGNATVVQNRNEHALMGDFKDELPGYLRNEDIVERLWGLKLDSEGEAVSENLRRCYLALCELGVMPADELKLLDVWLDELSELLRTGGEHRPGTTPRSGGSDGLQRLRRGSHCTPFVRAPVSRLGPDHDAPPSTRRRTGSSRTWG